LAAKFNEISSGCSDQGKEFLKLTEEFTTKEQERFEVKKNLSSLENQEENRKTETKKNEETPSVFNNKKLIEKKTLIIF
jgi:hypothetical protein